MHRGLFITMAACVLLAACAEEKITGETFAEISSSSEENTLQSSSSSSVRRPDNEQPSSSSQAISSSSSVKRIAPTTDDILCDIVDDYGEIKIFLERGNENLRNFTKGIYRDTLYTVQGFEDTFGFPPPLQYNESLNANDTLQIYYFIYSSLGIPLSDSIVVSEAERTADYYQTISLTDGMIVANLFCYGKEKYANYKVNIHINIR